MTDRSGIFEGDDPIEIVRRWLGEAEQTEPNDPSAIALSTVDADGRPNVRMVLLKDIEPNGFVFFTNYESVKSGELSATQFAAFCLHWKSLRRQVRVRGAVEREDGSKADNYYDSRSLESRLGAWASPQSQPIEGREVLLKRVAEAEEVHGDSPPRPPFWGGFRIVPFEIEIWADGDHRLHDRFRFTREADGTRWAVTRLAP